MNMKEMKHILSEFLRLIYGPRRSDMLKVRIARRQAVDIGGLYKVLDRDRFYARAYTGLKNPMKLLDISTTGCAFKSEDCVNPGDYIEIELKTLSSEHVFDPPLILACEAVYCIPFKNIKNRIGTKFLDMNTKTLQQLSEFIYSKPYT